MNETVEEKIRKLIKYGKEKLKDKNIESQATTLRGILDDIENIIIGGNIGTSIGAVNLSDIEVLNEVPTNPKNTDSSLIMVNNQIYVLKESEQNGI